MEKRMKPSLVRERKTCRVCQSNRLVPIFSLGNHYISDYVERNEKGIKAPLDLILCKRCSLLQLKHTAPQELLYRRYYWYRSGVTQTMSDALKDIALAASRFMRLKPDDVVLDLGANDGTLLSFYPKGILRIGCEPANNLVERLGAHCDRLIHDFWNYNAYKKLGVKRPKIVTAIGMFYDMEDPNQFVADAAHVMDPDGIFIAQLMCLKNMLAQNDVGNICHEHLEYYSLPALTYLFERNGLEIFKIEENSINGGSYRIWARHLQKGSIPITERFTKKDYKAFFHRIEKNKKDCVTFIQHALQQGKLVYAYGASTKGNTILQYYGLTNTLIRGAAEKSPEKWGKYTVGTRIPIVPEAEARKMADYFLILPYAFANEFIAREEEWRKRGGKFILPLPTFQVV